MMIKPSKYNYIVKAANEDFLVCNLIKGYKSMRLLPKYNSSVLNMLNAEEAFEFDAQNPFMHMLLEAGFLIDQEKNELHEIDTLYENKVHLNCLNLIIMTTGQCNFRCKYCYEDFQQGEMSPDIQARVIKLIQKQLNSFTRVSIEWFGGEPLVGYNVISNIMQYVKKMCTHKKASFRSGITTNGYLLTPEIFDRLYHMNVLGYQITLDGSKTEHDKQRVLSDGSGTFDRIMSNLLYIRNNERYSKARITLRVNLTKPIVDNLSEFLDLYKKNFSNDKRFSLLFKPAGDLGTKDISDFKGNLLATNSFGVHDLIKQLGLLDNTEIDLNSAIEVLTPMSHLCYAARKNSYVIGPDASVYKCTVHFDKKINQIGYLDASGNLIIDEYLHSRWYRKEKDFNESCRTCKFFPVCYGGGCTYYTNFNEQKGCCSADLKRHIEDYMLYISRYRQVEQIDITGGVN